jgi:hypothetical protein
MPLCFTPPENPVLGFVPLKTLASWLHGRLEPWYFTSACKSSVRTPWPRPLRGPSAAPNGMPVNLFHWLYGRCCMTWFSAPGSQLWWRCTQVLSEGIISKVSGSAHYSLSAYYHGSCYDAAPVKAPPARAENGLHGAHAGGGRVLVRRAAA